MAPPLTGERQRVSFDLVACAIILFLSTTAPAFNVDDAAFFNYLNNVQQPSPLYYYNGYVHLIPQIVAYVLLPFPLAAQAALYRVAPFAFALLLYREASRVFAVQRTGFEARLLALAVVQILMTIYVGMGAVLGSTSWIAALIGLLVVIRVNAGDDRYSARAMAAVFLFGIAFPPGLLLAGLCAFKAADASGRRRRAQNATLALLIVLVHAWFSRGFPDPLWNSDIAAAPEIFLGGFREHKLHNLVVLGSLAIVTAAWLGRGRGEAVIRPLFYVSWGHSIAFLVSSRFGLYGGFEPQYVALPAGCALIAVCWIVLAKQAAEARAVLVGACGGVAVMVVAFSLYESLRGPLELALMKYRFVMMASAERDRCSGNEAFVFEDEESSPIVLCQPRPLPDGKLHLVDFVPWVGHVVTGGDPSEKPSIINPQPLW
jgi:hypothetical protein